MNFVCAFPPEAIPLIEELSLKKQRLPSPFALFKNESHQLVISGMGKQNIATAIGFLHGIAPNKLTPWFNFGLAGHGDAPLGTACQIIKCTDTTTQKSVYPPPIFSTQLTKTILHTCEQPSTEYNADTAYDMEGSAFFETATRFCPRELVQSVKIISDNPESPLSHFDKSKVSSLITPSIPIIKKLIEEMEIIAEELTLPLELESTFLEITRQYSLTETQVHQLTKLIRHAHLLELPLSKILTLFKNTSNVKSALSLSNQLLEERKTFP
jgi:adenosylhomocysteine nucleosidase